MNTMQAGANITVNQSGSIDILISWLPFDFPLDVAAFVLNETEKVRSDSDFIYLNGNIDTQADFISLSLNGYAGGVQNILTNREYSINSFCI